MGTPRRRRRRGNHAPAQEPNQARLALLVVLVVALWFGLSIAMVARLERAALSTTFLDGTNTTELQLLKRRRHRNLPQYPIDHRLHHDAHLSRGLSDQAIAQCHKALWHTLETTTYVLPRNETFVVTGDIEALWLRDSAAQIHPLLLPNAYNGRSLVQTDPALERVVSGLILKTARYIRFDPYANAFSLRNDKKFTKFEREALGRHGYISTWNYELDSAAYYLRMLYFFHVNFPGHPVLHQREVREAVAITIDLWKAEQRHEEDAFPTGELFDCVHCGKPYRYNPKELKRNGKGTATAPDVGLTWSGFRPSDDACVYGYLVPANMFAVVALGYAAELAEAVWIDEPLMKKARQLRDEIDEGIRTHGIVEHKTYGRIYAYEVDGMGRALLTDDANVPSLLSMPYLGYRYDEQVFANTKRFLLSKDNPTFHTGRHDGHEYSGIGSKHTHFIPSSIWPMAMIMEGLISPNVTFKVQQVEKLLASSDGTGWMHESFNPNNPHKFSRDWFCWPDALFAELVMSLTAECPRPQWGRYRIKEWRDERTEFRNASVFARPPPPSLDRASLAVVSACIPGKRFSDKYVNASVSNKRAFCKKWGATCVLSQETHDANRTYSAKWEKLYQINQTLHTTNVDWIMWLDCDAAFTNFQIDWRKHLRGYLDDDKVLIASKDKNGFNLGVLFIPNTPEAREFIILLYEMRHWIERNPNKMEWKDQAALAQVTKQHKQYIPLIDGSVPQGKINSFFDNPDGWRWKEGEWIAHQVWCQKQAKCQKRFMDVIGRAKDGRRPALKGSENRKPEARASPRKRQHELQPIRKKKQQQSPPNTEKLLRKVERGGKEQKSSKATPATKKKRQRR